LDHDLRSLFNSSTQSKDNDLAHDNIRSPLRKIHALAIRSVLSVIVHSLNKDLDGIHTIAYVNITNPTLHIREEPSHLEDTVDKYRVNGETPLVTVGRKSKRRVSFRRIG
jgi:hypothetical protein